jgi:hypothetical protein
MVVAGDDAMGIVLEIAASYVNSHDFRLKGVKVCGRIDTIAQELLEQIP